MSLTLNQPAPDFTADAWFPDEKKPFGRFSLGDYKGRNVVLAFYPGDFTVVCTKEMCDFRDNLGAFNSLDALVVGISIDDAQKHAKFAAEYGLTFPLIADTDKKVGEAYGVKGSFLIGGMHQRALFVIDKKGNLVWQKVESLPVFRTAAMEVAEVLKNI